MVKWKYVGRHGSLDLVADSYTCLIKKYGGPMLIFANGSRTADVIFRPDAGFSAEPGKFVPEAGTDSLSGKGDKFEFSYTCDDGVRLVVSFYDDRIEAKADRQGEKIQPQTFYIGRGSKLYTNQVFSPSQPDFHLPIGHYLRPEEEVDLSPGLMTPAPWCFSALEDNANWMGFSLEPSEDELNFVGFGSNPNAGRDFCWRVMYKGCMPACESLSIPVLVMRFGMKDEFEVFRRHTEHLLKCGKVERPEKIYGWHRGGSVCGWGWQEGTSPEQAFYEQNVAMLEEKGIDYDILIIDDFWGEAKDHGVWEACERWPDLRGFIDARHAEGRRVLLWVCTLTDGLPENDRTTGFFDG